MYLVVAILLILLIILILMFIFVKKPINKKRSINLNNYNSSS